MIKLSRSEWFDRIKPRLLKEYGPTIAISYVCRRELGFTVREHRGWIENLQYSKEVEEYQRLKQKPGNEWWLDVEPQRGYSEHVICLDFYNDQSETFFRLRYLNT